MNRKGRLIALGTCAALGAALAIPPLVGADAPVPLALNSKAVGGYKVSKFGKDPSSIVPTDTAGKLPMRVIPTPAAAQPGQVMTGAIGTEWTAAAANSVSGASASFPLPLPKKLGSTNIGIAGGAYEDPECDGSFEKPSAPAGHLCIYPGNTQGFYSADEAEILNIATNGEGNWEATPYLLAGSGSRYGFRISAKAKAAGAARFYATWAYTAPSPTTTTP